MAFRAVDVILISARDLDHGNRSSEIKAYAVAWITMGSESYEKISSPLDTANGSNPDWNYHVTFLVEGTSLLLGKFVLEVGIYTYGQGHNPEKIGRVSIPLNDFQKPACQGGLRTGSVEYASYTVYSPSGQPKGILNLAVKIGGRTYSSATDFARATTNRSIAGAFPWQPTYNQSPYQGYPPVGHSPGPSFYAPPGPRQGVPHYQLPHPLAFQAYSPQGNWRGPPQGVPYYRAPYQGYPLQGDWRGPPSDGGLYAPPPQQGGYPWPPYQGYPPQGNHISQHNLGHSPVSFASGVVTVVRALLMLDDLGNLIAEFTNN